MSLLTICQIACDEVGLDEPATIIGSTEITAKRCLRFANRTGKDLIRKKHPDLTFEHTFPTVASQQGYNLPADYDHFIPFTWWNRTTRRRLYPITAKEWQDYQSGIIVTSINDRFRIRGKSSPFLIFPTPTSVETISFEYVSENFCKKTDGTDQSEWLADTDTGLVDEEIFELGVIWRLLNRLGMPYADEKAEYQRVLDQQLADILPQALRTDAHIPAGANIPDSDYPAN